MNRRQDFHETLIPLLVSAIGAKSYLELGTHQNETIGKVVCEKRYGVDFSPQPLDGVHFFAMSTDEFMAGHAKQYGPYDFVFIDADHECEQARKDFTNIWPYVSSDGLVCLHDTNPETRGDTALAACADSWRLAMYLDMTGYESVTLPYHPGLTIVRRRVVWGPER